MATAKSNVQLVSKVTNVTGEVTLSLTPEEAVFVATIIGNCTCNQYSSSVFNALFNAGVPTQTAILKGRTDQAGNIHIFIKHDVVDIIQNTLVRSGWKPKT